MDIKGFLSDPSSTSLSTLIAVLYIRMLISTYIFNYVCSLVCFEDLYFSFSLFLRSLSGGPGIGDEGCRHLAEALKSNRSLTALE